MIFNFKFELRHEHSFSNLLNKAIYKHQDNSENFGKITKPV